MDWSEGWVGLVVGANPIGGWLFGLFIGKYLMVLGRKKIMFVSLIISVITLVALGLCYELRYEKNWFMIVSLASRFL